MVRFRNIYGARVIEQRRRHGAHESESVPQAQFGGGRRGRRRGRGPRDRGQSIGNPGAHDAPPSLPDDPSVDVPVVAHVRDVRKGLVSLYTGDKEITIKDRRLAAALFRATH